MRPGYGGVRRFANVPHTDGYAERLAFGEREPWMRHGLCRQVDPDLWFPDKGEQQVAQNAKKLCIGCPVIEQCLEYALNGRERFGVWGGKSERERRKILKGRAA